MTARFPNLYLVGAPKCGTTSLAYWLGQHPDIFAPVEKEPAYFGFDLAMRGERPGEQRYLEHYRGWRDEAYALDATPSYLVSASAAEEIHARRPDSRILVLLRNPVEALHSNFHHARFRMTEPLATIEEALAAEPEREATRDIPRFGTLQCRLYSRIYSYAANIRRYLEVFGEDRVRIMLLDDFRRDGPDELARLFAFLGIDEGAAHTIRLDRRNEAGRSRSAALARLAIHPPGWAGRLAAPFLSRENRNRVRQWLRAVNTAPAANPPLEPATRAMLAERFRSDVDWLSVRLGRDLSHWLDHG